MLIATGMQQLQLERRSFCRSATVATTQLLGAGTPTLQPLHHEMRAFCRDATPQTPSSGNSKEGHSGNRAYSLNEGQRIFLNPHAALLRSSD